MATQDLSPAAQRHLDRLKATRRGRIFSGEHSHAVDILEFDDSGGRVKVRFDSTQRVDWYPRSWVYPAR